MIAYRKSIYRIIALSTLLIVPSLGTSIREAHAKVSTQGTTIQGSRLQGAEIQGAKIQGAKIQGTKIQGAKIQGAKIQGTKFQGAKIQGPGLQAPVADGHWLRGLRLIGVRTLAAEGTRWQLAPCIRLLSDGARMSESAWLYMWSQASATQDAWPAD